MVQPILSMLLSRLPMRSIALGRRESATLFMTLLAAFNVLLSRYSGQDDIVVGSPIAGRSRPELEKLIGFFVNTLVYVSYVHGAATFRQLVARVREPQWKPMRTRMCLRETRRGTEAKRDLSRNPSSFRVMFRRRTLRPRSKRRAALRLAACRRRVQTSKFDLTVTATEEFRDCGCIE